MILISHRGNTNGPNKRKENTKEYIDNALNKGYHVELDIWFKDGKFFLGHDVPEVETRFEWLLARKEKIWIHCKNAEALFKLTSDRNQMTLFYHEKEDYSLIYNGRDKNGSTVNGVIWAHNIKNINHKCVIPLLDKSDLKNKPDEDIWGICSDYVDKL
tara:strand:- start:22 stop:495 length:474 start_codon:yes stop_codon:yes gene_type:complete